jgi:hypothetical protein
MCSLRIVRGADRAVQVLRNHEQVFNLETGSGVFRFAFKGEETDMADLLGTLVTIDVLVSEFREEPINLEEAFFKLTKGEVA